MAAMSMKPIFDAMPRQIDAGVITGQHVVHSPYGTQILLQFVKYNADALARLADSTSRFKFRWCYLSNARGRFMLR